MNSPVAGETWLDAVIDGAVGGLAATLPMTLSMLLMRALMPWHERYDLEPQLVTESTAKRLRLQRLLGRHQRQTISMMLHFGFGAAAGSIFGLSARLLALPLALGGVIYGLLVWTGAYAGVIPMLGILRPPHRRPRSRNAMMIVAHVVWGGMLGLFLQREARQLQRVKRG